MWLKIPLGHRSWKRLLIRTLPPALDETVARKWMSCLRMAHLRMCPLRVSCSLAQQLAPAFHLMKASFEVLHRAWIQACQKHHPLRLSPSHKSNSGICPLGAGLQLWSSVNPTSGHCARQPSQFNQPILSSFYSSVLRRLLFHVGNTAFCLHKRWYVQMVI